MRSDKTGIVSIDLERTKKHSGSTVLELCGQNTGNLLFTHAVYTHACNPLFIEFDFAKMIPEINGNMQSLLIPAANWIFSSANLGFLADLLEQVSIPVCCVGIGSQLTLDQLHELPEGNLHFLKVLARKCDQIGTRGDKTNEILGALGIFNTIKVGCPSMFPNLQPPSTLCITNPSDESRISVSFTRFGRGVVEPADFQRRLAGLAARFADSIVLQSEEAEIQYLERPNEETASWLCSYYGICRDSLPQLLSRMEIFNSQSSWIEFHRSRTDFTISSRIHGCIASLLAGKPALLLAHDQRTTELAQTMGIPYYPISCIEKINAKDDLVSLMCNLDYSEFFAKQSVNLEKLKYVYKTCGVATRHYNN